MPSCGSHGYWKKTILMLRYEQLPDHYFKCGMLGHLARECPSQSKKNHPLVEQEFKYGSWLRVWSDPHCNNMEGEERAVVAFSFRGRTNSEVTWKI
ncbi:hypothetical protein LWI28_019450 [Acer negundo]|uniref:CCHC-type domain-containing protein n=1 Tax=Acer negundo TaxID=4023 RepID=A0AAD5NHT3_ACENE|nr:hypothetical protein LWI28_019450 [Acer negundo]KAK4835470.1 hypothetical protein QYF36_010156 [Acer negundo]